MRRHLARPLLTAALGATLAATACSGSDPDAEAGLSPDAQAACEEYHQVVNDWSRDYGAALAEVGEAESSGEDGERREAAAESVRGLFQDAADRLRAQAGETSDEELSSGLTEAADGLAEIAGRIETYQDVEAAPEWMSSGQFAEGGQKVNDYCAR